MVQPVGSGYTNEAAEVHTDTGTGTSEVNPPGVKVNDRSRSRDKHQQASRKVGDLSLNRNVNDPHALHGEQLV